MLRLIQTKNLIACNVFLSVCTERKEERRTSQDAFEGHDEVFFVCVGLVVFTLDNYKNF